MSTQLLQTTTQEQVVPSAIRHCMIVHNRYPERETRVERQAMALRKEGIAVDVICLQGPGEARAETVHGVSVYRLPVRHRKGSNPLLQLIDYLAFFLLAFFKLNQLHRSARYQVVQVHNLPDFLVFVAVLVKWSGAKVILDLHDLMPEFYAERMNRGMGDVVVRLIGVQERLSCAFADHVLTVTELWRQTLIRRGVPPSKVSVVMNVADDRVFTRKQLADAPILSSHNGSEAATGAAEPQPLRLICHGTMAYRYGLDLLLYALQKVRKTSAAIHLTLHGTGEYQPTLVQLASELGLTEHVTFSTRSLSTADLAKLIMTADVGVVPYRNGIFTGGILPTKMLEYAALGIPVIAARTPAIATYFAEDTVQFFSPGDVNELAQKILELYQNRQRLARLAEQISAFSQRYQWRDVQAGYVELIKLLPNNHLATEVARDELVA